MHSKNLIWFVLPFVGLSLSAQVNNTNKPVRLMSLSETLELALAHNLNLKVQRLVPEVARYNVEVARAGGSDRLGLQNLNSGRGPRNLLTARDASYDPVFFAQGVKSYDSFRNTLTYARQDNLQKSVNDVNRRGYENLTQQELNTQAAAQRDLIRANGTIRNHSSSLANINDDLRTGKISAQEAQLQIAEENAQFQNAQSTFNDASLILANSSSRLSSAQTADKQSLANLARAQDVQNFLNNTPVGGEIPGNGLIDPETGTTVYPKEVNRDYSFATGFRGAFPLGTVYEIRLDTENDKSTLFDQYYASSASITVGQPLLRNFLTDEARTAISTSKKDLQIAEYGLQFAIMDTITRAQVAYYDLLFAEENVRVQDTALRFSERLLSDTESKVKTGQLAALDLKQAEAQKATAQANLMLAQKDRAVSENNLKNFIGEDYRQWQNITLVPSEKLVAVPEMFNLGESWSKALQSRPEYNQARLELEKQNIILRFRKNQLLPDLDLVGSFSGNGFDNRSYGNSIVNIDGESPSYFLGAILTMNLWNRSAKNQLKITQADKQRALFLMKQLEQNILTEVDNNMRIAQSEYGRVQATHQASIFSQAAYEAEVKKLENGKSTAFIVLEMQRNLINARFAEINALAAYNKALAQLYFSEGSTLERHNIRLDIK